MKLSSTEVKAPVDLKKLQLYHLRGLQANNPPMTVKLERRKNREGLSSPRKLVLHGEFVQQSRVNLRAHLTPIPIAFFWLIVPECGQLPVTLAVELLKGDLEL